MQRLCHVLLLWLGLALMPGIVTGPEAVAGPSADAGTNPSGPILVKAPPGFVDSCARYRWLCTERAGTAERLAPNAMLDLARRINARVNRTVTPLSDPENFGVAEYWTLPVNGSGDCEDYALEKYRLLLEAGIDGRDLRIAVVLDRNGDNHVVLVLRHPSGDLVLDSLTDRILAWNRTGYRFLAMQYGTETALWEVVAERSRRESLLAAR